MDMKINNLNANIVNTTISNIKAKDSCDKTVQKPDEINKEIIMISSKVKKSNLLKNKDKILRLQENVTGLQEYKKILEDDLSAIKEVKEEVDTFIAEDKGEEAINNSIKKLINKIDENSKKMEEIEFKDEELEIINSKSLDLVNNINSDYVLESVRVGGENYIPNYSFDISTIGGSSAAMSVIESAISKINNIRREIEFNINELIQYPEILELDRAEYMGEQSKVRSANTAQILVNELKSAVRTKINHVQSTQNVKKISEVISLLTGN